MSLILGRITVNNKEILEVDGDPALVAGTKAPLGSLALHDTGVIGRMYLKNGVADTAWTQVDTVEGDDWNLDGNDLTGLTFDAPDQFFGSNNNYDVSFRRNSIEIMRMISEGLLIGASSSIGGRLQISQALTEILMNQQSPAGAVGGANVIRISRQFKVQTVDDTITPLVDLAIPEDYRMQVKAYIGCNQHGGVVGDTADGADYERTDSVKRLTGASATIEKWQSDFTSEDVGGFKIDSQINGVSENFEITVQGATDRNLAWSAHVEYSLFSD